MNDLKDVAKTYKKVGLLEFDERRTGCPFGKKEIIMLSLAIAVFALLYFIPLPGLSHGGSVALAIVVSSAILYACPALDNLVVGLLVMFLAVLFKIMPYGQVAANIGQAPFIMLVCMFIFAKAILNTNTGQRLTFIFIRALGKSPAGLVWAFYLTSEIISAFIVSMPVMVIMLPIGIGVLKELKQQPGNSNLGAAIMAAITMGSMIGGVSLICGSGLNPQGIAIIETATDGAITVSFAQWAAIGVPFCIITTPICCWTICKAFGINKNTQVEQLPKEYIDNQLKELGKVSAAEMRFVLSIAVMLVLFLTTAYTGLNTPMVCIIGLILVSMPGWGVVNVREAVPTLPWDVIVVAISLQIVAVFVTSTGLAEWLINLMMGWTYALPEMAILVIIFWICALVFFVTNTVPMSIMIPGLVAFSAASGANISALFMAVMLTSSLFLHVPWNATTMLTYNSGYWNYQQFLKVGWLVVIPVSIIGGLTVNLIYPFIFG